LADAPRDFGGVHRRNPKGDPLFRAAARSPTVRSQCRLCVSATTIPRGFSRDSPASTVWIPTGAVLVRPDRFIAWRRAR